MKYESPIELTENAKNKRPRESLSPLDAQNAAHTNVPKIRRKIHKNMTATQLEQLYNLSTKPSNIQNRQVTPNLRPNRTFSNSATAIHDSDGSSSNAAAHSTKTNDKTDGWNTPRKTSPNKTTNDNWSIETTNNKFALPCSDTNKDESQDDLSASLNTSTIDAQDLEDDQEQLNASQNIINNSSKPTAKPPPIHTSSTSIKLLMTTLNSITSPDSYYIKSNTTDNHSVYACNNEIAQLIREALKVKNIAHFTYTPKQYKNKLLILKGVNGEFTAAEVLEALSELKIPSISIAKVSVFNPNNNNSQTKANKLFLVHLTPDSQATNITKQRKLLNQIIHWEPLRKTKIFQCKNCQRIGHSSANCCMGYRCVKCLDKHKPGECQRTKNSIDSPPGCVNCNNLGHPANYRGCPFLKFAQERINTSKRSAVENRKIKISQISRSVNPNLSYAQAVLHHPGPANASSFNPHSTTAHHILQPSTTPIAEAPPNFINLFNSLRNDIIQTISTQNQQLTVKIINNTNKIDFILDHLHLKWTE